MMRKLLLAVFCLSALWIIPWAYGGYEAGEDAFQKCDYPIAFEEFLVAARDEDARAQAYLGRMYHYGQGVKQDYGRAFHWLKKAADRGEADAQFRLAGMYESGLGIPKNLTEAVNWYRRAAEAGDSYAQLELGKMYANGRGVLQDFSQALKWLNAAADRGHPTAQEKLAKAYRDGKMVKQDYVKAYFWFSIATLTEQERASKVAAMAAEFRKTASNQVCWEDAERVLELQDKLVSTLSRERDELVEKMTLDQVAQAQKQAREWKPKKLPVEVRELPIRSRREYNPADELFDDIPIVPRQ